MEVDLGESYLPHTLQGKSPSLTIAAAFAAATPSLTSRMPAAVAADVAAALRAACVADVHAAFEAATTELTIGLVDVLRLEQVAMAACWLAFLPYVCMRV